MSTRRPSRSARDLAWLGLAALGALALAWAAPLLFTWMPHGWSVSRADAEAIGLERLRDLGELPSDPYVVTSLRDDTLLEIRLEEARQRGATGLVGSRLADQILIWEVVVYPPGAQPSQWRYRARVSGRGEILELKLRLEADQPGNPLDPGAARALADEFLRRQGFDLASFAEPEVRSQQLAARTDLTLRYRERAALLGEAMPYGVELAFAGDRLAGFAPFLDDPDPARADRLVQPAILVSNLRFIALFLLAPLVGAFFLKRYHAGEVGVERGVQIFGWVLAFSLALMLLVAKPATQGFAFGPLSREQVTWVWGVQMALIFFLPMALACALSWSVGESFCRERWGAKLAAFDALWQRRWDNATVPRSALRGLAMGLASAAVLIFLSLALRQFGAWAPVALQIGPWWDDSALPGLAMVLFITCFTLYNELFGRLFLLPALVRRLGLLPGAALAALISAALFFPPLALLPTSWSWPAWIAWSAISVFLFLRYDLLTTVVSGYTLQLVLASLPLLYAGSPSLRLQGTLALVTCAVPLLLALRHLGSAHEFVYRYEDVPKHVRRIAERERQRVELETARNIQSSILPELPPQVNGVEIAHAYQPATEVGGDFYDVLALEDGRLAVAVGDVAGHGVSSGLVMSMAKSALAVQVTFDPRVEAVFGTLNRMIFQSARKRLLATLCYALVDPVRRELQYASAGHLFPYRVNRDGKVEALESVAYPLGVRPQLEVRSRVARLEAGDLVVLYSDGVVEAHREGSDDLFGFERMEQSLRRLAGHGPERVRDGLLADLAHHIGDSPREDDLTVLVLRVP